MPLASLPKIRPYAIVGLSAFVMLCWLIAVTTNIATAESNSTKVAMGVWFTCMRTGDNPARCVYNTDEKIACGESKDHFRALQAFFVLLLIITMPIFLSALLEIAHKLVLPNHRQVPGPLGIATLYVILAGFGIVFALIAFAIGFAIPHRNFCGSSGSFSDIPNFAYGASPVFGVIAWITMIVVVGAAGLVPGPDDGIATVVVTTTGAGATASPNASPGRREPLPVQEQHAV